MRSHIDSLSPVSTCQLHKSERLVFFLNLQFPSPLTVTCSHLTHQFPSFGHNLFHILLILSLQGSHILVHFTHKDVLWREELPYSDLRERLVGERSEHVAYLISVERFVKGKRSRRPRWPLGKESSHAIHYFFQFRCFFLELVNPRVNKMIMEWNSISFRENGRNGERRIEVNCRRPSWI